MTLSDIEKLLGRPIPSDERVMLSYPLLKRLVDKAEADEWERCARIAELLGTHPELNVYAGGPEWYRHGQRIAAAIRGRE